MRMSQLFSQTLREAPAEAEVASHQLLLRAGFIRQLAAGVFSYLPLARRSLNKIEEILRQEMNAIGGQEITMPVVHPGELWKETGRWQQIDAEMGRFKDRAGRDMALAMTHEEVVGDLTRKEVRSYRHLPKMIYHIQTKWRDDPRPRAGLIRAREFTMKDSYSLDASWEGLDKQYQAHYEAYFKIFQRCGLETIAVSSDTGMMGGSLAHEYMFLTPIGEDTLLICDACGYAANRQIASFHKSALPAETPLTLQPVETPACKTIEALANFLQITPAQTAKAVFLVATVQAEQGKTEDIFVFAVVRGDMDVNETKLANTLKARSLRPALEEEIRAAGAEPGYASPIDLGPKTGKQRMVVVVDELVTRSSNLAAGANRAGYHLLNTNYGRDYTADQVAEICAAREGDGCPNCQAALKAVRGVELGNIFKLGTRYSQALGATFLDKDGIEKPVIMGSYGIGVGRLLACVAEAHHDEKGLCWPVSIAPYPVHLVLLAGKPKPGQENEKGLAEQTADQIYTQLRAAGLEPLYDDRSESAGIKFNDADLIGLPVRITVGERALQQGGVEVKQRRSETKEIVPLEQLVARIKELLEGQPLG